MARRSSQTRGMTSREAQERVAPGVQYRKKLDIPQEIINAERKKGFGVRWIAMTVHNHPLDNNVESRLMNNWTPIAADEYPKLIPPITLPGKEPPKIVVRGGQILCRKRQVEIDADRQAVSNETAEALQSVNWSEKDNSNRDLGPRVTDQNQVGIERVTSRPNAGFKE